MTLLESLDFDLIVQNIVYTVLQKYEKPVDSWRYTIESVNRKIGKKQFQYINMSTIQCMIKNENN